MKHRNPELMRQNARAVLCARYPRSVNQIFNLQAKPRLPRAEIAALMRDLVARGEVEEIEISCRNYYRLKELAVAVWVGYNGARRNEFSHVSEVDWFLSTLAPLRQGQSVHLSLDDPRFGKLKNYRGRKQKKLVILIPGPLAGLRQDVLLVSIVGSGSCLIRPQLVGHHVADLVLAGMPAKLATVLMNKLHLLFQE